MSVAYELDPDDRTDLEILIGSNDSDPDLVKYYKKAQPIHKGYLRTIMGIKFDVLSDDMEETVERGYGTQDILESLVGVISGFEKILKKLFLNKRTKERIGYGHSEVCELFAKNTIATSPVEVVS